MRITKLDHLVLTVADIDKSCAFYTRVLGMRHQAFTASDGTVRNALYFGEQKINLHQQGREFKPCAKAPAPGSADLCFIVSEPIEIIVKHLSWLGVPIEEGPVARSGATCSLDSIYIRDPDANLIELSRPRLK